MLRTVRRERGSGRSWGRLSGFVIFWFCFFFSFWALSSTGTARGTSEGCLQSCSWSSPAQKTVGATNPLFSWLSFCKSWKYSENSQAQPFWGVPAVRRLKIDMNWTGFKTLAKYLSIHCLPQRMFCRGAVLMHKLGSLLWYFKATGPKTCCKIKRACEGARLAGIS